MAETSTDRDITQQTSDDAALLRVARRRFQQGMENDADYRDAAVDDLNFIGGNQWPDDIQRARELAKRPCLTINQFPQFLHHVTNEQRQNRPGLKVSPVDDQADKETARVLQGIVRHICVQSDFDTALDTASEGAAGPGRGFFRVLTDYEDPRSFEQIITIERVRNALNVTCDPHAQRFDYSDMQWAFITQRMSREEFLARFPYDADGNAIQPTDLDSWSQLGDNAQWVLKDSVQVAEYFYKEVVSAELAQLTTGEVVVLPQVLVDEGTDLPPQARRALQLEALQLPEGVDITRTRQTVLEQVKWCKINGYTVLERTEWLGKWIPLIPVIGNELDINGKVMYSGIVRNGKDAQRMYNYWASAESEGIALAPRSPYVGAVGQFEGMEDKWGTANTANHAYLEYNIVDAGGQPAPPPQRNVVEPAVAAITQARLLSRDDLKSTTGIYDPALGQTSQEKSGIAIGRRQQQSQVVNFHYYDNTVRAIRHLGRILIDLIPKIYDSQRVVRIIGEDGKEDRVMVGPQGNAAPTGYDRIYDVTVGTYDVTVDAGPSYQTKRQEAADSMQQVIKAFPPLLERTADLVVRNMDWPDADAFADRLTPPEYQSPDDESTPQQQLARLQGEKQQAAQQMQALNAYAQQAEQQLQQLQQENDQLKQQFALKSRELDLKERELTLKTALEQEKINIQSDQVDLQALAMQVQAIEARLNAQSNGVVV